MNPSRYLTRAALVGLAWSACSLPGHALPEALSRAAAARLQAKATTLAENAVSARPATVQVKFSETEVNSYLAFEAPSLMPSGVRDARVSLLGEGKVAARAIVDLDAVRKQRSSGGWLDPLSYVGGLVPIAATGTIETRGGTATLKLERAEVYGVPIPKALLQEVVAFYTRSREFPAGVDLDAPFPLPARIRSIGIGRGEATVSQ